MRVRPFITGFAIVLGACGTAWTVDKFEAPEAGFAHRRTYAWKDSEFGLPAEVDPAALERADRALRSTIDSELASKGYVPAASADSADMLVSYQVVGQRRFVIADDRPVGASAATEAMKPGTVPGAPPSSTLPKEQTVRDGTVIVFIDDPSSKRLIWRGLVSAEARVATTEGAIQQVTEIARQIAREIPGRTASP
jgi:Domain of unknown function (DUF4136)